MGAALNIEHSIENIIEDTYHKLDTKFKNPNNKIQNCLVLIMKKQIQTVTR